MSLKFSSVIIYLSYLFFLFFCSVLLRIRRHLSPFTFSEYQIFYKFVSEKWNDFSIFFASLYSACEARSCIQGNTIFLNNFQFRTSALSEQEPNERKVKWKNTVTSPCVHCTGFCATQKHAVPAENIVAATETKCEHILNVMGIQVDSHIFLNYKMTGMWICEGGEWDKEQNACLFTFFRCK